MKIKESKIRSVMLSPSEARNLLLEAFCSELGDGTTPSECKLKNFQSGRIKLWVREVIEPNKDESVCPYPYSCVGCETATALKCNDCDDPLCVECSFDGDGTFLCGVCQIRRAYDAPSSELGIQSWEFDASRNCLEDFEHDICKGDTLQLEYREPSLRGPTDFIVNEVNSEDVWIADKFGRDHYASWDEMNCDERFNRVKRVTLIKRAGE